LQSISGVSAINPLVAFYDIHGGKREVLFFYFDPDTTRDMPLQFTFVIIFVIERTVNKVHFVTLKLHIQ
jgi:NAD-specific glutamate dehydrogenase